jgi:hypothetical protein
MASTTASAVTRAVMTIVQNMGSPGRIPGIGIPGIDFGTGRGGSRRDDSCPLGRVSGSDPSDAGIQAPPT